MSFHGSLTTSDGIHSPLAWVWADATARTGQTVGTDDINKIGLQEDTGLIYRLANLTPTWSLFGGGAISNLDDLADVNVPTPNDRDILTYDTGAGEWVPVGGLLGGTSNVITTSGDAAIVGGDNNDITNGNDNVIAGGNFNSISNGSGSAIVGSQDGTITGAQNAALLGSNNCTVNQDYGAIIAGENAQVTAQRGVAIGRYGHANKRGQVVASGAFSGGLGATQGTVALVGTSTITHNSAAWNEIFISNTTGRITIPSNGLVLCTILLIGSTANQAKRLAYKIEGVISNVGGTTSLLTSTVTTIYEDDVSFDARILADDPNDALVIEVQDTDGAGDVVRWVYNYRSVEMIQ